MKFSRKLNLVLFPLLAGVVLLAGLSGCFLRPTVAPTVVPTLRPTSTPTGPLGLGEAGEAWFLMGKRGTAVWPGWGSSLLPLLIRMGEADYLIGHPSPPQEFVALQALQMNGKSLYRKAGHLVPVPAATAWNVAGVWSVAVPERLEFQRYLDEKLGPGQVKLDSIAYIRAIVHEGFHAYQMTVSGGKLPTFGPDYDEQKLLAELAARSGLGDLYTAEGQALANGLRSATQEGTIEAVARFLAQRHERRVALTSQIATYEQSVEWIEGLARYADTSLMRLAGQFDYQPLYPSFRFPTADESWEQFLKELASPTLTPDGFRGRYYSLGAGQAFLLDRLAPGWKDMALLKPQPLEKLLEQAIKK